MRKGARSKSVILGVNRPQTGHFYPFFEKCTKRGETVTVAELTVGRKTDIPNAIRCLKDKPSFWGQNPVWFVRHRQFASDSECGLLLLLPLWLISASFSPESAGTTRVRAWDRNRLLTENVLADVKACLYGSSVECHQLKGPVKTLGTYCSKQQQRYVKIS
jgi:hypothetical protein